MPRSLTCCAVLSVIFAIGCHVDAVTRQIKGPQLNPNCPQDLPCSAYHLPSDSLHSSNNLLYYINDGLPTNNRLHFILSTINGLSILLLETTPNATLNVDWLQWLSRNCTAQCLSIEKGRVLSNLGVSISKLYRYNDHSDRADVDMATDVEEIPLENLLWAKPIVLDEKSFLVQLTTSNDSTNPSLLGLDGSLTVSFQLFDTNNQHANIVPHLLHNDQSAELNIELVGLTSFNKTNVRYALEIVVLKETQLQSAVEDLDIETHKSINDEYTPGIFRTHVLSDSKAENYLMWKPVCYSKNDRNRESLTKASFGQVDSNNKTFNADEFDGLSLAYYGTNTSGLQVRRFNVSFGMPKDKFYNGYLVWTFHVGFGRPLQETFSALIISLVVLCVATPGGAMLAGGVYGTYRKMKKRHRSAGNDRGNDER